MLKKLSLAVAVASASLSGMAFAETFESPVGKFDVGMTATFVSDYVSRGASYNGGHPTVQTSLDVSHESGVYAGVWGSSQAGSEENGGAEIDVYIGYAGQITEDISFDVSAATYMYPGTVWGGEEAEDDIEYIGSLGAYGATVGVKYRSEAVKQMYYFAGYDFELGAGFGLSAAVGQTQYDNSDDGEDFVDWSVGISKSLVGLDFGLAYADNDMENNDDNIVFSVSKTF